MSNPVTRNLKSVILVFLLLIPIISILQFVILGSHLRYAFADVDWMFLLTYKGLSALYHDPISHLLHGWQLWGVYTYQIYYIGLIEQFFGLDYYNFQLVTIIFKIIASLSIYPLIFLISRSKLAAFLTTLIYAVAYSSVGVMYTVVTSGLFVAIPMMSLFFIWYYLIIKKDKNNFQDLFILVVLFFVTVLLATERMYPLVSVIFLIESFWCIKNNFYKKVLFQSFKRTSIFVLLFVGYFLYKPSTFILLSGNTVVTYQKFMLGNWQVILSPFISLGSLFLPRDSWPILGVPRIESIPTFLNYYISGPLIYFFFITIFFSIFVSKHPRKFIFNTLISTSLFAGLALILSSHQSVLSESIRMHFDPATMAPALIGGFVLSFSAFLFKEWLDGGKKDNLLIGIVGGIAVSFVFIVLTWVAADWILVFTGVHRYLTIPAIGSSLMIAFLMTIVFNKLKSSRLTNSLAYLIFLILIPLIIFNAQVISANTKYDLEVVGMDAAGHIRMKNKLWSFLTNISNSSPSAFYFDESQDYEGGYFDETTIMAGFGYWMRFRGRDIVTDKLTPALFRSNLICSELRSMCLGKMKDLVIEKNGEKGILYGDKFYKSNDFYAFRFINRDIIDITPEVKKDIGLD